MHRQRRNVSQHGEQMSILDGMEQRIANAVVSYIAQSGLFDELRNMLAQHLTDVSTQLQNEITDTLKATSSEVNRLQELLDRMQQTVERLGERDV